MKWNIHADFDQKKDLVPFLLANRGVEDVGAFLNPLSVSDAFNLLPQELKSSVLKAKDLVLAAVKDGKKIVIHGDYDSDGINATAILYSTIKNGLGYEQVYYFIPNRFDHGYGVSTKSTNAFFEKINLSPEGAEKILVITVDNGITAVDEVSFLKQNGHQVIITDHHQLPQVLPPADAIVWSDQVVGATLSWFLSKALGNKDPKFISMAALATVTDLQPLVGFNRSLVKRGLEIFNSTPPVGLKKLIEVSGKGKDEVTTYDLGWILGPRLNASGRLVDAGESVELLLADDPERAQEIAIRLNDTNTMRQDKTMEMYVLASVPDEKNLPKIILSSNSDYHEGIIGLVAARLTQKYYRPAIVISVSDGFGKGSVRSIPGINIIEFLRNFQDMFESIGGHPMAAGFTIKKELIPELHSRLLALAETSLPNALFEPVMDIDLKIPLNLAGMDLLKELDLLKPFGLGNEEPVFASFGVGIMDVSLVGRDSQHALFKIYHDGKHHKGIYFNAPEGVKSIKFGDKADIVYTLKKNEYNGNVTVDLFLKDIRLSLEN